MEIDLRDVLKKITEEEDHELLKIITVIHLPPDDMSIYDVFYEHEKRRWDIWTTFEP